MNSCRFPKVKNIILIVVMGIQALSVNFACARRVKGEIISYIPGTSIEIVGKQKIPSPDKPVLAIFDVHGTLLEATWMKEYADIYNTCTGSEDGKSWVAENAWGKTTLEVLNLISGISGKTLEEVKEVFRDVYEYYRVDNSPEVMPYALDMIKGLAEEGIPVVAVSGSAREIVLHQLEQTGFLDYIKPENVISQRDILTGLERNIDRADVIECLRKQFPDRTFLYFDDWIKGVGKIVKSDSSCIVFGLPQGEYNSGVWLQNRKLQIAAGANYILKSWADYRNIVGLTANTKREELSVAGGSLEAVVEDILSQPEPSAISTEPGLVGRFNSSNQGRDFTIYTRLMDAALEAKANSVFPHFGNIEESDVIVDAGSGTGQLAELMAREFRGASVYALDISHELQERAAENQALTSLVYGDAQNVNFPPNSVKLKCYLTSGHEIESFGGSMVKAMGSTFIELKPGGRVLIRDFVKPSKTGWVYMQINSTDGLDEVPEGTKPEDIDYSALSSRALFDRFYQEFRGGGAFEYKSVLINGEEYIKIRPGWAYEFYMRKDYTANWRNEIKEKYSYWTLEEAKSILEDVGYGNVSVIPEYNDWIISNRLKGQIELYEMDKDGKLHEIELPPTHMLVVADKPGNVVPHAGTTDVLPQAVDYKKLFSTITIDWGKGVVNIGEHKFQVETNSVIVGTKKLIFSFKLKTNPQFVLKVVRSDTRNDHNVFKSMFQIIKRQGVLDEFEVPHFKLVESDPEGPPYRYVVQESAPSGALSAADLILEDTLTEEDIRQIAEIVNRVEKSKQWQLDMNPFSWFKVTKKDGSTQMVYAAGKVYLYDEQWEFSRIGLLQWIDKKYIEESTNYGAAIPTERQHREFLQKWQAGESDTIEIWKKYLNESLQPAERAARYINNGNI